MIINRQKLLELAPLSPISATKNKEHGVSWGLAEVGYDIRIKQDVWFYPNFQGFCNEPEFIVREMHDPKPIMFVDRDEKAGKFTLASTIEQFNMPNNLVGIVHDKSTWARRGLSVFNTVIEPKWSGFLTIELVYHGNEDLHIPAGSGIAQVIFHEIVEPASYDGKYQNQIDMPVAAILE